MKKKKEHFQLLNRVEMTRSDDGGSTSSRCHVQILDEDDFITTGVSLDFLFYAAVEVLASIWDKTGRPMSINMYAKWADEVLRETLGQIDAKPLDR